MKIQQGGIPQPDKADKEKIATPNPENVARSARIGAAAFGLIGLVQLGLGAYHLEDALSSIERRETTQQASQLTPVEITGINAGELIAGTGAAGGGLSLIFLGLGNWPSSERRRFKK